MPKTERQRKKANIHKVVRWRVKERIRVRENERERLRERGVIEKEITERRLKRCKTCQCDKQRHRHEQEGWATCGNHFLHPR